MRQKNTLRYLLRKNISSTHPSNSGRDIVKIKRHLFQLQRWKDKAGLNCVIGWDDSITGKILGYTDMETGVIYLSSDLLSDYCVEACLYVLMHEYAHVIAPDRNHDQSFLRLINYLIREHCPTPELVLSAKYGKGVMNIGLKKEIKGGRKIFRL